MKSRQLLNSVKRSLALILALFMLFALFGCTEKDINSAIEIAEQLLSEDTVADTAESASSVNTDTETDIPPPEETTSAPEITSTPETASAPIDEDSYYYSRDDVALYLHTYNKLPSNFITKAEAEELGWSGGSVERYLEGAAIGGDKFGNREGLLPQKSGRTYRECDIDTNGASSRGAKRIVYSNDGLIYYTDDHYESFTLLYGEE